MAPSLDNCFDSLLIPFHCLYFLYCVLTYHQGGLEVRVDEGDDSFVGLGGLCLLHQTLQV
jgi:hypothetical protein